MGINELLCRTMGLPVEDIKRHYKMAAQALKNSSSDNFMKIVDTCRISNGMVMQLPSAEAIISTNGRFASFVPSAGAATRYLDQLAPLIRCLRQGELDQARELFLDQFSKYKSKWCLPVHSAAIIADPDRCLSLTKVEIDLICRELSQPKALFPCVREGVSFLQMKAREHQKIPQIAAQVFITPRGHIEPFSQNLQANVSSPAMKTVFFEQDESLSTIRLDLTGEPILDADGKYSIVPAGHGALVKLLPKVAASIPEANAIFIRNIDNVNGGSPAVVDVTTRFLTYFQSVLTLVKDIRLALQRNDYEAAAGSAKSLVAYASMKTTEGRLQGFSPKDPEYWLWQPIAALFHSVQSADGTKSKSTLLELYSRPLNILGVVPNSGTDMGGTPTLVQHDGELIKVCLEIPNASPADCDAFIRDPKKATHFNPVFVASELSTDAAQYQLLDRDPFWLISKKRWQQQDVTYYETVLFELLGNSRMANLIFVEVPRIVFNPHKTLEDAQGRSLADWNI